mmetsp:Transcript_38843/g.126005  ORF Transcript_38843/g.126005 Transcript_38843/m.126005 type:complete len:222 (-) Transcript_38843:429-1094(-)
MSVRAFTRIAAGGGGLLAAGFVDRALTPQTRPLSTAAAAAGTLGHIRLYQYQICPFCNKIKALLDLHGLEYETVDVNPLTKKEIKPWSEYRKVPIAVLTPLAGGEPEQINDSPVIAERLLDAIDAAALRPARAATPRRGNYQETTHSRLPTSALERTRLQSHSAVLGCPHCIRSALHKTAASRPEAGALGTQAGTTPHSCYHTTHGTEPTLDSRLWRAWCT